MKKPLRERLLNLLERIDENKFVEAIIGLTEYTKDPNTREGGILAAGAYNTKTRESAYLATDFGRNYARFAVRGKHAAEKIARTLELRINGKKVRQSSSSADPKNPIEALRTHPGCFMFVRRNVEVYFAFSGAASKVDEAICYALGVLLGFKGIKKPTKLMKMALKLLRGAIAKS